MTATPPPRGTTPQYNFGRIYNRYKEKQQTEQQAASAALKRGMSERERESEVIDIDNDITVLGASKQTNRTVIGQIDQAALS
jgi:hypothetical protein